MLAICDDHTPDADDVKILYEYFDAAIANDGIPPDEDECPTFSVPHLPAGYYSACEYEERWLRQDVNLLLEHKAELNRLFQHDVLRLPVFVANEGLWHAWDHVVGYDFAIKKIIAEGAERFYLPHAEDQISVDKKGSAMPDAHVIETAAALQAMHFDPIRYVVPKYVPEGLTLFAGKPKIGKSWFALDIGLAVASEGYVLGTKAEQGDVLYLGLEDNQRRLKNRIEKILGPFNKWPERFQYATSWPRLHEGGLDKIRQWIVSVPQARLIVVDVLTRIRAPQNSQTGIYEQDYKAIADLQAIASEKNIAILVVHHLRKSAADSDKFDTISGTMGLSGAADSVLILANDGQGVTLYGRGRDVEEIETAVQFNRGKCRWEVLGAAADVRRSTERKAILKALQEGGTPLSRTEIAAATGMAANNVDRLLWKMRRDGEVSKKGRGIYQLAGTEESKEQMQRTVPAPPPLTHP